MPWRLFWVYFVGCALIAASLSIATKIEVRWSGLLFGIMMFLFVAMIHLRGALANPHDRIIWTIGLPRDVVWRRRLDSCGECNGPMAPARQEHADNCGAYIYRDRRNIFWR
jgi:hypothetical protein